MSSEWHETVKDIDPQQFSLAEKIGQMVMVGFRGTKVNRSSSIVKAITEWHLGGVWLTDNENELGMIRGNIRSPEQVRQLVHDLQGYARLPLFISIDAEGGQIIRLKEKFGFPPTFSAHHLGSKDDLSLTRKQAQQIASLLRQLGINFNFVPVLDLNIYPDSPALGKKERCYSADPQVVIRHAREVVLQHHQQGILCAAKHFPGHGSARQDTHHGFVDVTETWSESELLPYQQLIAEGILDAIITAHIFHAHFDERYPATLSRKVITGLLRGQMHFEGVVISDDLNMGAIQYNYDYKDAVALAIEAGVDILLQSNVDHYDADIARRTIAIIKQWVESGRISPSRIDESFMRIMSLKSRLRLHDSLNH